VIDVENNSSIKIYAELVRKVCYKCKLEKEISFFRHRKYIRKSGLKVHIVNMCKQCEQHDNKIWIRNNKDRRKELTFRKDLKRNFNITPEIYREMLKNQNNRCASCPATTSLSGRRLAVDHCHNTNRIRGLLCNECNTALGLLKEDEQIISDLRSYLIRTRSKG
jgi:Recombination endonuclease VII